MLSDPMYFSFRNESSRTAAWRAHYMRKGCAESKAHDVARRKVERSNTWPPKN